MELNGAHRGWNDGKPRSSEIQISQFQNASTFTNKENPNLDVVIKNPCIPSYLWTDVNGVHNWMLSKNSIIAFCNILYNLQRSFAYIISHDYDTCYLLLLTVKGNIYLALTTL